MYHWLVTLPSHTHTYLHPHTHTYTYHPHTHLHTCTPTHAHLCTHPHPPPTHSLAHTQKLGLRKSENPWIHWSDCQEKGSEEDQKTTELYRKFQAILNKLTPQKFQTLAMQALLLEINTKERLIRVVDMIFTRVRA